MAISFSRTELFAKFGVEDIMINISVTYPEFLDVGL